jgi:mevalonate kinase
MIAPPRNNDFSRSRASGKIILFGEHAVVYGQPALAVSVNEFFAEAEVSTVPHAGIWISAPDIGLHQEPFGRLARENPLASVVEAVFVALGLGAVKPRKVSKGSQEKYSMVDEKNSDKPETKKKPFGAEGRGIEIKVTSTIPIASGLGSGAAVSVSIIRALSAYLGNPLGDEKVNKIAYEVEKIHHGTPSGIDNTVVTYGKPIFFVKDKPIELLEVAKPFTIIIADTGIPAPTKKSVADVRKLWVKNPEKMNALFAAVGSIVKTARQAIEGGHPEYLGALMNENHRILQEMSVSSPELNFLTETSLNSGAFGAKLSGGGRGGNMIALSTKENAPEISEALYKAGAKNVIVTEVK